MELLVTGFNAWNQLKFDGHNLSTEEPDDIHEFTAVLKRGNISILEPKLSYTIGMYVY
jgi:hypothetical protein